MKLTVEQSAIAGALASCARIITRKATIPVMQHVLVEADAEGLRLTASDLDCEVTFRVPAKVDEPGSVAMLGDTFAGAVDRAPTDRIVLQTASNGRVVVRSGSSRIQIPTMDPADFPYLTASDLVPAFTLAGEDMADMIGPCLMAASADASRGFLCGVHMHMVGGPGIDDGEDTPRRLAFAAANGNVFMVMRHEVEDGIAFDPFTLPTKAAAEVARLAKGSVRVEASLRLVRFTFADGAVLTSKLVEGGFPDYAALVPGAGDATTIDAKLLSAAIGRLALADNGKDAYAYARLDIRDGVMVLDRETSDRASVYEEVPCETGAPVMFATVHSYLSTGLKALGGDRIEIVAHHINAIGTQLIGMRRAGSDDALFIAAPLRLKTMVPAKAGEE